MKASEIVNGIKDLLKLSKQEAEKVEVVEDVKVELAEDDNKPKEEPKAEAKPEEKKEEVAEVVAAAFATQQELSQVKMELLEMIKSIIEDKTSVGDKEVPQELSTQVELEKPKEIVHSPEAEVDKKKVVLFENKRPATIQDRINQMLFNN